MFDYAVVGGGIGGVVAGALLSHMGRRVILFEKLSYLGGCAGTFKRKDFYYNVGATTFVGLEDNMPLGRINKLLKLDFPVKPLDVALTFHIGEKTVYRYRDFERSLEEIERAFPNPKNRAFWKETKGVNDLLWHMVYDFLPYPLSPLRVLSSAFKHVGGILRTLKYHVLSTKRVALTYLGKLSQDYMDFIDYHVLITAQAFSEDVPFIVGALGLSYPNMDNYYVMGGMSALLDTLAQKIYRVERKTKVLKIEKVKDFFRVYTNRGLYEAKRVILNKALWNFDEVLSLDGEVKEFVRRNVRKFRRMWGALTLYLKLKDNLPKDFPHHNLIILKELFPETSSRSVFLSVSDREDPILSKDGYRSATVSTHSFIELWEGISQEEYRERKERIKERILKVLRSYFPNLEPVEVHVGTPLTFERYTDRYRGSVGGIPIVREYYLLRYPSPKTPVDGLYLVGDTVFPGQGWPGVTLGAINLVMLLEKELGRRL